MSKTDEATMTENYIQVALVEVDNNFVFSKIDNKI